MPQNELLSKISRILPEDTSVIHAVAETLEISYQSAQRRVNANAKITIDEAILLAKRYNISIDSIYDTGNKNIISVKKTEVVSGLKDFEKYFNSFEAIRPLLTAKNSKVTYCAKDLPIFHSSDGILSKFKILYKKLSITEIWDITILNSTLKQLDFYTSTEVISRQDGVLICNELIALLNDLHNRITPDSNYKLYYNELLLMSNSVLIETPIQKCIFVPFTIINYFNTTDPITCEQFSKSIRHQIGQSKLLNVSGEKEKKVFFNKVIKKITDLKKRIEANNDYDIN